MSAGRTPPLGALRDRVSLFSRQAAKEAEGGHTIVQVPLGDAWARVRPLAGRITSIGDGRTATITHSVVLRYRTDLKPGDQMLYRGTTLDLVSAEDLNGRRAYLACRCTARSIAG